MLALVLFSKFNVIVRGVDSRIEKGKKDDEK